MLRLPDNAFPSTATTADTPTRRPRLAGASAPTPFRLPHAKEAGEQQARANSAHGRSQRPDQAYGQGRTGHHSEDQDPAVTKREPPVRSDMRSERQGPTQDGPARPTRNAERREAPHPARKAEERESAPEATGSDLSHDENAAFEAEVTGSPPALPSQETGEQEETLSAVPPEGEEGKNAEAAAQEGILAGIDICPAAQPPIGAFGSAFLSFESAGDPSLPEAADGAPSPRDAAVGAQTGSAPEPGQAPEGEPRAKDANEKIGFDLPSKPAEVADKLTAQAEDVPSRVLPQPALGEAKAAPERVAHAPAHPSPAPASHQVPLGAVAVEIGLKTLAGVNRFEIRLDPAELGRIDVQLDISEDGEVKAHLVVDRVETLFLLQRDARTLERAFEQAGLKPSEGGVDLSLRDPAGDARHGQRGHDERNPMARGTTQREAAALRTEAAAEAPQRMARRITGVDLRI